MGFLATANLPAWAAVAAGRGRPAAARPAAVHGALRRADHLLLLLLHLGGVQSRRDGGEPAQVRRLPAGHPPGQAHGRIPRLRADPPDRDRRGLHHRGLPAARGPDRPTIGGSLLLRRHLDPDRGLGDHGHRGPDPVAPAGAPVRRPDQEVEAARRGAEAAQASARGGDEPDPVRAAGGGQGHPGQAAGRPSAAWSSCPPATCCARRSASGSRARQAGRRHHGPRRAGLRRDRHRPDRGAPARGRGRRRRDLRRLSRAPWPRPRRWTPCWRGAARRSTWSSG